MVESAIKTVTNNSNGTYRVYNLPSDSNSIGVSNNLNGRIVVNEEKETQIALYAYKLEFIHPVTKEKLSFQKYPSDGYWTMFTL